MAYLAVTTLALEASSKVVDDNVGSSAAEEQSICATKTTTGAGDDDGLAVVAKTLTHDVCDVLWRWTHWLKSVVRMREERRGGRERGRCNMNVGVRPKQLTRSTNLNWNFQK
jgi:hypothetical protein